MNKWPGEKLEFGRALALFYSRCAALRKERSAVQHVIGFGLTIDFGRLSPCSTAREAPREHSREAGCSQRNRSMRGIRVRRRHRDRRVLGFRAKSATSRHATVAAKLDRTPEKPSGVRCFLPALQIKTYSAASRATASGS